MLILDDENNDEKRRVCDWFPPPRVSTVTPYGSYREARLPKLSRLMLSDTSQMNSGKGVDDSRRRGSQEVEPETVVPLGRARPICGGGNQKDRRHSEGAHC